MNQSSTFQVRQSTTALLRSLVSEHFGVILVRAGTKRIQQGSRSLTIQSAMLGVLPAHLPMTIENTPPSTGPYAASLLVPAISVLEGLRREGLPDGDPWKTTRNDRAIAAFERAVTQLEDPLAPERIRAHAVSEVLLWLAEEGIGFGPGRPRSLASKLRTILSREPGGPWNSGDAARALAVSEPTLQRRLAADGTSFSDLLADVRMTHALGLLQTSDLAITRVAMEVGYASASRFAVRFRARFGISPSDIRRRSPELVAENERNYTGRE